MNWIISVLILMTAAQTSYAENFSSTVHSIDFGKRHELHLVRFDNSRVSFLNHLDHDLLESFLISIEKGETVNVQIDAENKVVAAQSIEADMKDETEEKESWASHSGPYVPSIAKDYKSLQDIYKRMRKDYTKNGECYSRAHIWAYEEHQKTGMNLMKNFMFFTERYIRKYKFHWWFHVTPMSYWGKLSRPRTLDRRYSGGPRQTKTWSDTFVKSKRTCKQVATFDEFWLNQNDQDCYHIYTSMYYVIPRDIEKRDLTGKEKIEFNEREIKRAYSNGF